MADDNGSSDGGENPLNLFLKIGLDERTAKNTFANNKLTDNLTAVIYEAAVTDGCDRSVGNLLYTVATKFPVNALVHRPTLLKYIVSFKIKTSVQLEAAFGFLMANTSETLKVNEFEETCGVGVEVSTEDIERIVNDIFEENRQKILEQRYRTNVGELFAAVRKRQPWADPKIVKQLIDALLSERSAEDDAKPIKKKKEKPAKVESKASMEELPPKNASVELNPFSIFPSPEENYKVHTEIYFSDRPVLRVCNAKDLLEKHLKATAGKVFTRFPPEPNGYLHIGHAKALFVNFGLAKERGGCCYLRYDDTNPEAEKKEYIGPMEEIIRWMGWEPFKISYTSDYFQELYELAVALIRSGHAYVDHQSTPHPRTGDKWCIYPSYDYAHCIVDSLENVTHSLCSLEFEIRRASYYWLLDALGLYKPFVWEFSRLNVTNIVISKRKLNRLVTEKWVDGWDDPRLMTLAGLRRKGVTPTAINDFVHGIGITRSDHTMIRLDRLEYHIREELNKTAPRVMVVLNPLKVVITNLEPGLVMDLDAKRWPDAQTDDTLSFYKVPFSKVVYIEHTDFRLKDSKDYYGLAPGKFVLLRYAFPIKCTEVILGDDKETVVELRAEYDPSKTVKPKGVLHWVAEPSPGVDPLKVEVRLFEKLFLSENPAEIDNWLGDINPHSKVVMPNAYAVPSLHNAAVGDKFQFERLGYFSVDKDSTSKKLVFNRTVTLRDSYAKVGK
nr:glutamine--tRNA ligase-like isoform X2 [Ipomoea trifida]